MEVMQPATANFVTGCRMQNWQQEASGLHAALSYKVKIGMVFKKTSHREGLTERA